MNEGEGRVAEWEGVVERCHLGVARGAEIFNNKKQTSDEKLKMQLKKAKKKPHKKFCQWN